MGPCVAFLKLVVVGVVAPSVGRGEEVVEVKSCLKEKSSVVSAAVFFVASVSMNSMLWVGKRRVKTA